MRKWPHHGWNCVGKIDMDWNPPYCKSTLRFAKWWASSGRKEPCRKKPKTGKCGSAGKLSKISQRAETGQRIEFGILGMGIRKVFWLNCRDFVRCTVRIAQLLQNLTLRRMRCKGELQRMSDKIRGSRLDLRIKEKNATRISARRRMWRGCLIERALHISVNITMDIGCLLNLWSPRSRRKPLLRLLAL